MDLRIVTCWSHVNAFYVDSAAWCSVWSPDMVKGWTRQAYKYKLLVSVQLSMLTLFDTRLSIVDVIITLYMHIALDQYIRKNVMFTAYISCIYSLSHRNFTSFSMRFLNVISYICRRLSALSTVHIYILLAYFSGFLFCMSGFLCDKRLKRLFRLHCLEESLSNKYMFDMSLLPLPIYSLYVPVVWWDHNSQVVNVLSKILTFAFQPGCKTVNISVWETNSGTFTDSNDVRECLCPSTGIQPGVETMTRRHCD